MEPSDLLRRLVETLERLQIPYLVTGSVATIAYGEPRLTNDIDVVVVLRPDQVDAFSAAFPAPEFDCPRDTVAQSVQQGFPLGRHSAFSCCCACWFGPSILMAASTL